MNLKLLLAALAMFATTAIAHAEGVMVKDEESGIEELNPFAPDVEDFLQSYDSMYQLEAGVSAFPDAGERITVASGCMRESCAVFVDIDKSSQTLTLYVNGRGANRWPVSTGMAGHDTPDFDKHFNGRIYQAYTSTKFPEGDYRGLGNMPYAMFISGGFAVHGTPEGNWRKLGRPASHGCIRVHPDNARYLNGLLRQYGVRNSWVSVH